MLRDRWLRDAELGLDDIADRPRRQLAIREELEDPPPDRVTEDIERLHVGRIQAFTYISQP